MTIETLKHEYLIPVAILAAGIILAGTVYMVRTHQFATAPGGDPSLVRPLTTLDHIIGSPTASVLIIEYADMDSPYSRQFQATMEQIMSEYAASGKVAWVYRHLPLTDINPRSGAHAEAAECASALGKPDTFWHFIDAVNASPVSADLFDEEDYYPLLPALGVDQTAFSTCLSSGKFSKRVQDDAVNGLAAGATASPFIVIRINDRKPSTLNGSLPYEQMKKIVDEALAEATPKS